MGRFQVNKDEYAKKLKAMIDSCENQDEVRAIIRDELTRITDLAIKLSVKDEDYMTAAELKKIKDKRKK